MKDVIKSINPMYIAVALLCLAIGYWFHPADYKLRQENKKLKAQYKILDSLYRLDGTIIHALMQTDTAALNNVDSIQIIRDENDTISFKLSDIDSIRNLWPSE